MRKLIVIIAFITFSSCQNNEVQDPSKFKTIMIKSVGEVETLPDMVTFHIDINCLNTSIQASKDCLVKESNDLTTSLQSFGIPIDDILTTSVNMNRSYTYRNNSRVFEGYRSSSTMFITVKNIEKLDEVYTELLENRNLELGGLNYSHTKLDSLKNEAYVNALDKAGILSDRLMENLPETDKEILKIGNIEITASMPQPRERQQDMQEGMAVQNSSIAINKGTVKVVSTLFVEYQIN